MIPTTVWGDISSLHLQSVTWSSKILNLDHHATHGFFTFLTDEELEADSLRFLCSNKKQEEESISQTKIPDSIKNLAKQKMAYIQAENTGESLTDPK